MSSRIRFPCAGLMLWLCLAPATVRGQEPLSLRNANYDIEVELDPAARTLTGRQILEWRNIQMQPTDELWFHLYWNAWRNNRSSWMLEDRIRGRSEHDEKKIRREDWGWLEVDTVRLLGSATEADVDLTDAKRFVSPDDGNPDDRTVMVVTLPHAVGPGATARLEMRWRAQVPRTFARTGYRGDYFFLAHWFPKLGVYEPAGWNCHQFHAATEFYSDYGVYDVRMTVPESFVVGATGREIERRANPDGSVTHRYTQEDVHAFTWTTSPHYKVAEERFEAPGLPPVQMRLLYQSEHGGQVDRHFAAARAAFEAYGSWYGPYPYGHVTLVDPAYESGAGGMEYPTLFTCGTRMLNPPGGDSPEGVTIHEAGHQFWYGIVGNNEFEHAWVDEGLNTFSTIRTLEQFYGERILVERYLRGFVPVRFPGITVSRWNRRLNRYRDHATADTPDTPTYRYFPKTASTISYDKTALWLATLERHLGWETLREILSTFFQRYSFRHPTPDDFFAVANEVSGRDLSWFFDQVHRGSADFDYAVDSAASREVKPEGFMDREGVPVYVDADDPGGEDVEAAEDAAEAAVAKLYRTEVVVRRHGAGHFPVDVLLVFKDGHQIREPWDGQGRWKQFVVEREAKLDYAEVDPDRILMLDVDRTNNSRLEDRRSRLPAVKWSSKWMIWLQDLLSTYAFFI